MDANVSAFQLSVAARDAICELVDGNCPLNRSEQPRFIIAAYIAVFVPWGFLQLFDMISDRWKTIRAVAVQGAFQIVIAIPTIAYTLFYIEIQRRGQDYKEMCAAIVAVCLSLFHFLRTAWGLWQLFYLWMWVKRSLRQLHEHGYDLHVIEKKLYHDENGFWTVTVVKPLRLIWLRVSYSKGTELLAKTVVRPLRAIWSKLSKSFIVFRNRNSTNPASNRDEHLVRKLAGKMYVNSSVIDNEFFECDLPFQVDLSAVHPKYWCSTRRRLLGPRHFPDSSIAFLLTFLAQYGREWLTDSKEASIILRRKERKEGFLMANFVLQAMILTSTFRSGSPREIYKDKKKLNWSAAWSRIIRWRETKRSFSVTQGVQMPFGFISRTEDFQDFQDKQLDLSFGLYKSKIERLIDNLPQGLFQRDPEEVKLMQSICPEDLENFLLFLQCKPAQRTGTVKPPKVVAPVVTAKRRYDAKEEAEKIKSTTSTSSTGGYPIQSVGQISASDYGELDEKEVEESLPEEVRTDLRRNRTDGSMDVEDLGSGYSIPSMRQISANISSNAGIEEHESDLVNNCINSDYRDLDEVEVEGLPHEEVRTDLRRNETDGSMDVEDGGSEPETSNENEADESEQDERWSGTLIERLLDEKLGQDWGVHKPEVFKGARNVSQKFQKELTVHLENLSALLHFYSPSYIYHRTIQRMNASHLLEFSPYDYNRTTQRMHVPVDWDTYLKQLRMKDTSLSRLLKMKNIRPRCLSKLHYWLMWGLPEDAPPALREIQPDNRENGIRFLGYIMEKIRIHLAEWTATSGESDLESCWTAKIPGEHSVKFEAGSDLSTFINEFEEREVPYISVGTWWEEYDHEDGNYLDEDRVDKLQLFFSEQIIWKCQSHLLGLMDKNVYGPGDVELIILFQMAFPVLRVKRFRNAFILWPEGPEPPVSVAIFLSEKDADNVEIEMKIFDGHPYFFTRGCHLEVDLRRDGLIIDKWSREEIECDRPLSQCSEFCWEEWIHIFDGCMKVLSLDLVKNDFCRGSSSKDDNGNEGDCIESDSGSGDEEKGVGSKEDNGNEGDCIESDSGNGDEHLEKGVGSESASGSGNVAYQENNGKDSKEGEYGFKNVGIKRDDGTVNNSLSLTAGVSQVCRSDLEKIEENESNEGRVIDEARECQYEISKNGEEEDDDERKEVDKECVCNDKECVCIGDNSIGGGFKVFPDTISVTTAKSRSESAVEISTTGTDISMWMYRVFQRNEVRKCTCEYKLGKKAEQRAFEGTNKYYWDWEGWKPQAAFEKHPILFDKKRNDRNNEAAAAVEEDSIALPLEIVDGEENREAAVSGGGNEEASVEALEGAEHV